ncbi:hypothetical protein FB384_005179 [Prauserella sediminis]|uniref:MinD-like ATPase involved in chromosome partitioning or flagellar assembly n=1 Tax=Prauserella sediminis TaxID=577680 RepID=A0A839XYP0_9PSEU|nr:carbon monoxide dehydrogenase maturation protein [Prauserella sediminis]MBB3666218.1 hypothetical protein [Prauserella sediminis]
MLIAVGSVKGAPGVTTVTTALAALWPEAQHTRRLVAELDPSGGDLAVRYGLPATPGLASFAAATRRTREPAAVWDHTHLVVGGSHVLPAPPAAAQAHAALTILASGPGRSLLRGAAANPGVVLLADCGRLGPATPAEAIARQADVLLLVSGTRPDELAHTAARLGELAAWTPRPCLLLTGTGHSTRDVERALGIPTIGRLPHDPTGAAALTRITPPAQRRRGLARRIAALARALTAPSATPRPTPDGGLPAAVPGVPPQQVRTAGPSLPGPPSPSAPASPPSPPSAGEQVRRDVQHSTSAGQEPLS